MNEGNPERPHIPEADGRFNLNKIRKRIDDIFVTQAAEITEGHSDEWQRIAVPSPRDDGLLLDLSRLHPAVTYEEIEDSRFLGYIQVAEHELALPHEFYFVGIWPPTERVELVTMQPSTETDNQKLFIAHDIASYEEMIEVRKLVEAAYLAL